MRGVAWLTAGAFRRSRLLSALLMFVVLAAAATGVAAGSTVAGSAAGRIDAAFASANGPDAVVTSDLAHQAAVVRTLESDPSVAHIGAPRPARIAEMSSAGRQSLEHLVSVPADAGEPGTPVLREGRLPATADEVALDAAVALDLGVHVGDDVVFADASGAPITFRVSGLAFDFSDCFHPSCDPARSWVTGGGLDRLGGPALAIVDADLDAPEAAADVERRLAAAVGDDAFGMNTWLDTRDDLLAATNFFAVFLSVFGVLVLLASAVVIAAVVSGRVAARRRQAGLHQAIGATPGQLGVALLLEHLAIAAAAALAGWSAAALLVPRLSIGELRVVAPAGASFRLGSLALVLGVTAVIVAVAVAVPALRLVRTSAVEALRDAPRTGRRSRLVGALVGRTSPSVELGARSWTGRPARSVSAVLALALAIVAGVVALTMGAAMDHLLANPTLTGDPWDAVVSPTGADDVAERRLDAMPEVESWYSITDTRATLPDGERVHLSLLGGDPQAAAYSIGAGRAATAPGELVAGYALLEDEGWNIGDVVELEIAGRTESMRIVGWYRETEDAGRVLQARAVPGVTTGERTYAVNAAAGITPAQLADALRPLGGHVDVNGDDIDLTPFRLAMSSMAGLLAVVALSYLLTTAWTNARLRANDRAVLTAVGLTRRQLAVGALSGAAMTIVVAAAVGLAGGWWLQGAVGEAITSGVGVGPGATPPAPIGSIAALALVLAALVAAVELAASTLVRPSR